MDHDAIVIGGSFAGLSAAIYIARARRDVLVIDAGAPRNRFAEHSHGFFSRDGASPLEMVATARAQVAAYPNARFADTRAIAARREGEGFVVTLANGDEVAGKRLVLAFGISDDIPTLPGIAERWGKSVIICPYCHGFEYAGRRLGVLYSSPMSIHQASLIPEWGPTTYFLNGGPMPEPELLADLERRGVVIEPDPVAGVEGAGTALAAMVMADGRRVALEALFAGPRNHLNSDIARQLGCDIEAAGLGEIVRTDEMKQTSVAGVFAAGDITRSGHNVTWASSDGVMAGSALHRSLVF